MRADLTNDIRPTAPDRAIAVGGKAKRKVDRATAAGLLLPLAAFAQSDDEKIVRETVSLDPNGTVSVDVHRGTLSVSTWDRDEVDIKVRIEADGAPEVVAATEVDIDHSPSQLHLHTTYPEVNRRLLDWVFGQTAERPTTHYVLRMPRTAHLDVDERRSTVEIDGLEGSLTIDSHRGTIHIDRQAGDVTLDTHRSEARLSSVTGHVTARAHRGSLHIDALNGPIEADTHRGQLEVGVASLTGASSIHTHRGAIDLAMAPDLGLELTTAFTSRTTLNSDFELAGQLDGPNYHGEIGGGRPPLELSGHRGQLTLRVP